MLHVTCIGCGVDGILLADESAGIPRCLQCGKPFHVEVARSVKSHSPAVRRLSDDLITTWLTEGPALRELPRSFDFLCRACGHAGTKPAKDRFGTVVCPKCGEVERPPRRRGRLRTICIDCGLIFELSTRDRGRTVICPGCNYFLGCLFPIERQRNRPFWSLR